MSYETIRLWSAGALRDAPGEPFPWMDGMAKWLLVLNLLDGIFTLLWVQCFGAGEANVLLRPLVMGSAVQFMLVKLALVSLGTLFLWRQRDNSLAFISMIVALFSYDLVLLVHVQYLARLFF